MVISTDKIYPRSVTERNKVLYLYNDQFCLIWKSEAVSFKNASDELRSKSKRVNKYVTDENVRNYFKYEHKPTKIEHQLTNFIVYDLETYNTNRARPYCVSPYRLGKIASIYNRDLTPESIKKVKKKDTIVFHENCITKLLDYILKLKIEPGKKNRVVEYEIQMHAHNGSGCDTWIIL